MTTRLVNLIGGSPWGLTIAGGKDFGCPIKIAKVNPSGKAARGGVKNNEYILSINDSSTENMMHFGAQSVIRNTGNTLQLKISTQPPIRAPVVQSTQPPPTVVAMGARPRPPPCPVQVQATPTNTSSNATNKPPGQSSPQSSQGRSPQHYNNYSPPSRGPATLEGGGHPARPPPSRHHVVTTTTTTGPGPSSSPPIKSTYESEQPIPSSLAPDAGLESGTSSLQQSPSFRKIHVGSGTPTPSVLQPEPPTEAMKKVVIEDVNVKKSSDRPQPPSNQPTKFTTQSIKVSSTTPSKPPPGPGPVAKPPVATAMPPPPSNQPTGEKLYGCQGVCNACNQPIRGPFASAMGHVYHPEHFVCAGCQCQLQNTTFVFEQGNVYCEKCYEQTFAQICFTCQKPIIGGCISAVNLYWHPEHFRCSQCSNNLSQGGGFNFEGGHLYCPDCFNQTHGSPCYGCGKLIGGDELWVEALEQTWHSKCFTCNGCHKPLEGVSFFAKLGRPYCRQCA